MSSWRSESAEATERDLVVAARDGDVEAGEELARRFFPHAWRAAYAIVGDRWGADDATQDGFERAFRSLGRFELGRPFGPWLYRITVNCALDVLRHSRKRGMAIREDLADPHAAIEQSVEVHELMEAIRGLAPERRAVVAVRLLLGYDSKEAAEILGVPVGTIHSRLSRATDELRRLLDG